MRQQIFMQIVLIAAGAFVLVPGLGTLASSIKERDSYIGAWSIGAILCGIVLWTGAWIVAP